MPYQYNIDSSEALKQGGFDFPIDGECHYIKVGDTTVNQLKVAGILPSKNYGNLKNNKPDGLILSGKNSVKLLIEYKKPGEFATKDDAEKLIYNWYFELAKKLRCNVICITDGETTYWFHSLSRKQLKDERGGYSISAWMLAN